MCDGARNQSPRSLSTRLLHNSRMAPKTTNLTILFADISGSTRLYEILGDAPARAKVASCLQLLTDVTERHGGTVIKTIGDEIMCTFPNAEVSVGAACEMHEMLEDDITEQTAAGPISLGDLNRSTQHLCSNDREGDVENETKTADLLFTRTEVSDVGAVAER